MSGVKFEIDPKGIFKQALQDASRDVSDLTVPLIQITKQWFQGNKAIFKLKGHGKFEDLSGGIKKNKRAKKSNADVGVSGYKLLKQKRWGFIYPILRASGRLERSITDPSSNEAIHNIVNKQVLYLGTSVPYGQYLQTGTKRMPARPYVLIGAEQTGPDEFNTRYEAFAKTLQSYVIQKTKQRIGKA